MWRKFWQSESWCGRNQRVTLAVIVLNVNYNTLAIEAINDTQHKNETKTKSDLSWDVDITVNTFINTLFQFGVGSFSLAASSLEELSGFLTGRPVDVSARGFLLQDHNRLCLVSNKDTFPGSSHVQREAADHVQESEMSAAVPGKGVRGRENGCLSGPCLTKEQRSGLC